MNFTRMSLNKLIVYQIQFLLLMNYLCGFHGHNCLATAPATLVTTPSSVNLTAATFHLSFCTAFTGFWYNARFVWYAQRWCIAFLWAAFAGFSFLTGEFEKFSVMILLAISEWASLRFGQTDVSMVTSATIDWKISFQFNCFTFIFISV